MAQHRDSEHWISNDQSQNLPSDADFLDPGAVIDRGEQAETARTYVRLNFFLVGVPALGVGSNFTDRQRFVAHISQQGRQHLVETLVAIEPKADAIEGNFTRG